ncbi:hypothetical protein A9Q84_21735 [Halobacteriovorax marinus]|uniref:Cyclic nucleotide-binding domain-containing protein n=1 Tax=Halobacteriovorax marinus TaxID=97084 RepID=A0A1Y5F2G4_9BACT|nr:hypothetical protein A9Q84_21735 [Halobacteriovorax marinus]
MNDLPKKDNFKDLIRLKKGAVLFHEGEASSFLYIVVKGKITIIKEDKGRVFPLAEIGEKSFIGELSMFNEEHRNASAIAKDETEVFMIKKTDIKKVLKNCPEWVTNIMVTLTDRLRDVDELMREHRVTDNNLEDQFEIHPEEQKTIRKTLEEYRSRRGI